MKTIKKIVFAALLASASTQLFAQTQPNPDAPQQLHDNNGPIKVLNAPPRQSSDQTGQAQTQNPKSIFERIRLGGSFGLSFGSITNINISPMLGLQATDKLTVGAGVIYQYYKSNLTGFNYKSNIFGGRAFAMYSIISGVSAHAEYESINRNYIDAGTGASKPIWLNSFLVGGTYSQPTGGRLIRAVNFTALYNLNYNNQVNPTNPYQNISPYGSPLVFRVSVL